MGTFYVQVRLRPAVRRKIGIVTQLTKLRGYGLLRHHPKFGNCHILNGYITNLRPIRCFSFECLLFELVQLLL